MSDGFFDMPAGYSDADLEMAALEEMGDRYARRFTRRGLTFADVDALRAGETLTGTRWYGPADARRSYSVFVRQCDVDEVGPVLEFSVDGRSWWETAKKARLYAASEAR